MSHDRTQPAAPIRNPVATGDYTPAPAPDPAGTQPSSRPAGARPDGLLDVPGYAVTGEIARGGMGRVLAATDLAFGREVAVKVLLPGHEAGEEAERFVREARITGRLAHPGIPPAYELGTLAEGSPFLAMKLVRGRTLAALLADRPDLADDRPRFVGVVEQIAQAVGFAHSQGVIHRDLKPANVMVGAFGEVQVMDWGLAREREEERPADGPGVRETALEVRAAALTVAGAVMGTPAYMAPEQARGEDVDARADVFALGGVLCEVLTGKRTFTGATTAEVMAKARAGDLSDPFARLDACGADSDLLSLAKQCLSPRPTDRPADGTVVAAELAAYRAGVEARLRQAETDRAAAEAKAEEQRKRRRVQLVLAGVVVLVAIGGGVTAVQVQARREQDRIAADETTRQKERETRAAALVDSLAGADPAAVPRIVADLTDLRDLARPRLVELAAQPVTTPAGLHARLALLPDELGRAAELAAYLPACQPGELLPIRDALKPHAVVVSPPLWAVLANESAAPGRRVRAAAALAGLAPADPRWAGLAPAVAEAAVQANPVEFVAWSAALEPVRGALLQALVKRYPASRERIESGKLAVSALSAEASGFDLTANLLARYAADRPAELAELAVTVDARHHALFAGAITTNRAAVVPLLTAELGRRVVVPEDKPVADYLGEITAADLRVKHATAKAAMAAKRFEVRLLGGKSYRLTLESADFDSYLAVRDAAGKEVAADDDGGGGENALLNYTPSGDGSYAVYASSFKGVGAFILRVVETATGVEEAKEALALRQANAAAVLLSPVESEAVWPLFKHTPDPTVRSYLVHRAARVGVDPVALVGRFRAEGDMSAKRALLLTLGEYPPAAVPDRAGLTAELLTLYKEDADAGLHGSLDWLLRQKWGQAAAVAVIDAGLAKKGGDGAKTGKGWYVNGEGQAFTVIREPKEFTLGSPATEPGRVEVNEPAHRKRIVRSFAIATKEVTVDQFLRFRPGHSWVKRYSPDGDSPAVSVKWYQAAAYCNWLSDREGIPEDQWCYEPNAKGEYGEGMTMRKGHLSLTGYRLPTEVEWEYGCRAGAVTGRYFGRPEGLLPFYAWGLRNADDRSWPVGRLKPNDLGLFDMLGNVLEWVEDPAVPYATGQVEDRENAQYLEINEQLNRLLRGGSFSSTRELLRCALRGSVRPSYGDITVGFRPSRTLLD
ncbi:bifunctional serine/threonine-protein kinase/formylglycine-generating enzyme family protein [Urbifossiella limnaea]|uniref:Serine/threonine-protein kinase PknB n=1 Tax=Urbifossiella limnaea TaxID=2528023 RepID=A0A517XTE8_9BACT|nr:bifunctional serine/threonine-protein kinase/formylglycine-generating enzyme family protein [Urbifossiella limnaea]QDU20744.1 Serine/threonine-protein kinase PknB [Urbifossiella limnaea]